MFDLHFDVLKTILFNCSTLIKFCATLKCPQALGKSSFKMQSGTLIEIQSVIASVSGSI